MDCDPVKNQDSGPGARVQLISAVLEHSILHVLENYTLENVVFCIAVHGVYKP